MRGSRRAKKTVDPFYKSKEWMRIRQKVLIRDGYRCMNCGASVRAKGAARVDHIYPRKKFPDLSLHMPALRTICVQCDNARSVTERNSRHRGTGFDGVEIDENGFPVGSEWAGLGK